jgi:hypothetical protein
MEPAVRRAPAAEAGFEFWRRWLLVLSCWFVLVGLALAWWPDNRLLGVWQEQLALRFFDGAMPADARAMRSFLLGPLGGTIAGFFVLQVFIVRYAFVPGATWAWRALASGLIVWFVVDSSVSWRHGAAFNVLLVNVPVLVGIGLPLAMTYRAMHPGRSA